MGYLAGSTGEILWQDTRDPPAGCSGGILPGIHWRAALGYSAGYSARSTGGLLRRDPSRILGGIHWLAAPQGSTGKLLWSAGYSAGSPSNQPQKGDPSQNRQAEQPFPSKPTPQRRPLQKKTSRNTYSPSSQPQKGTSRHNYSSNQPQKGEKDKQKQLFPSKPTPERGPSKKRQAATNIPPQASPRKGTPPKTDKQKQIFPDKPTPERGPLQKQKQKQLFPFKPTVERGPLQKKTSTSKYSPLNQPQKGGPPNRNKTSRPWCAKFGQPRTFRTICHRAPTARMPR